MEQQEIKVPNAVQKGEQKSRKASPERLKQSINILGEFGGFSFLESTIEGVANMNPERSTRKKIFLTEADKKKDRETLLRKIELWIDILNSSENVSDMLGKCEERGNTITKLLSKNQLAAVESVKELERSYRSVMLFFKNTEADKVRNITIMNASMEQITDLDNSRFIDHIAEELSRNFDKLDLRMNYSLLVLPGYLGSNKVVEKWAKIAHRNKVMLITDFADLDKSDDVVDMFASANLTGGDTYRSNVMMCCNYLIGRSKYSELGETENLRVAPSTSLAGRVYSTLMSQVTAGKKYGGINEVDGVTFTLKKSELSQLESVGLIPMVNEYGKVMAFSGRTLFVGDNLGLETYAVVRVFDHITKVLFDFLNRRSFENWSTKTESDLRIQILKFLDDIKGPDRLIEKFKITRFEQDKKQKDRVFLDISITPYFPSKSFIIKLEGTKGDEDVDWETEYNQV